MATKKQQTKSLFIDWIRKQDTTKLAKELGCTPSCVNLWKTKERKPSAFYMVKLIEYSDGTLNLNSFKS